MRAVGTRIAIAAVAVGGVVAASASFGAADAFAAGTPTLSQLTYTAPAGSDGGLDNPMGVSTNNSGTVYVSNTEDNVVAALAGSPATTTIYAGSYENYGESGDGGPATSASLYQPSGTAVDAAGDLFIADAGDNVVREVTPAGTIKLYAGNGTAGYSGDNGPATSAELDNPQSLAVDAAGDLFIADTYNNVVREVTPDGKISTFAGDGTPGYQGDNGKATQAWLTQPSGVAVDSQGNVYIADSGNNVIRRVGTDGMITTVAGNYAADQANDGLGGFSGDGGPATEAQLHDPQGVALDAAGDLFIADTFNNAIREVTPNGTISTVVNKAGTAGAAPARGSETNGTATNSKLSGPYALAVDNSTGNLYIADTSNNKIAVVNNLVTASPAGPGPVAGQSGPTPSTPEAPLAVGLPLAAVVLGGGAYALRRRKARGQVA